MYKFDIVEGSLIMDDKAYNDYASEDLLEDAQLDLQSLRRKNSKQPVPPWAQYLLVCYGKVIEATGSLTEPLLPNRLDIDGNMEQIGHLRDDLPYSSDLLEV